MSVKVHLYPNIGKDSPNQGWIFLEAGKCYGLQTSIIKHKDDDNDNL